mgnify:CR=1 FL=1
MTRYNNWPSVQAGASANSNLSPSPNNQKVTP